MMAENREELNGKTYSQKVDLMANELIDFPYQAYGTSPEEDEEFRISLNKAIVRKYFMREIGYETPELWLMQLETRLRFLMPKYRELYKTTLVDIDLDNPYHLVTTHNQTGEDNRNIDRSGVKQMDVTDSNTTTYGSRIANETTTDSTYEGDGNVDHSDLPQFQQAGQDYVSQSDVSRDHNETHEHVDNAQNHSGSDRQSRTQNNDEEWNDNTKDLNKQIMDYIHSVQGHTNNLEVLDAIEKWRNMIINIEEMICNDISDLFMNVY